MYMYMCVGHQRVWRQCMYYVLVFVCTQFACVCNYNYVCMNTFMCAHVFACVCVCRRKVNYEEAAGQYGAEFR